MNCKKISRLIYKDIDGLLTDKEKEALNSHIKACKKCEEEYKFILNIKKSLEEERISKLPEDFKIRLREKLVEYNLSKDDNKAWSKRRYANFAAAVILPLVITVFSLSYFSDNLINRGSPVAPVLETSEDLPINNQMLRSDFMEDKADFEYMRSEELLTITINQSEDVSDIPYLKKNEDGSLIVSMDKLPKVKEKLSKYVISNESEETLNKDYFIIRY